MERLFKIRCSAISQIMGNSKIKGELSQTCKSYLHTWYANDNEIIQSKYFDKGNIMENEAIDLMANVLNYGLAFKNEESKENEYFTGTADVVLHDIIIDLKCPWNKKTLHSNVFDIDSDYEWQGRGYMHLYKKEKFILFYALMDTPEDLNYGNEISYTHIPLNERWLAYQVNHDENIINLIIERVKQCRQYLEQYDKIVKSKLGKITIK